LQQKSQEVIETNKKSDEYRLIFFFERGEIRLDNIEWLIQSEKKGDLNLIIGLFSGIKVEKDLTNLKEIENSIFEEIKSKYTVESLKDDPKVRSYRDFFWKWKIADPTRVRPASEALIRRILINNNIWKINTFVNSYNLASAISGVSLGAYDHTTILFPLQVRFAKENEVFLEIGSSKPKKLSGKELVLADQKGIISLYPHRDADRTKITLQTKNAIVVAFGVPGISETDLKFSMNKTAELLKKINGGILESIHSF